VVQRGLRAARHSHSAIGRPELRAVPPPRGYDEAGTRDICARVVMPRCRLGALCQLRYIIAGLRETEVPIFSLDVRNDYRPALRQLDIT
jgi:hypothetical protein